MLVASFVTYLLWDANRGNRGERGTDGCFDIIILAGTWVIAYGFMKGLL